MGSVYLHCLAPKRYHRAKFFRGHRKHPDRGHHPHGPLDLLSAALAGSATSHHLTDLLSQRWPDLPAPLLDDVPSTILLNSGLWRQWLHYMFFRSWIWHTLEFKL